MMEYNYKEIETHWQAEWKKNEVYKVAVDAAKPKYYVLDMFPYPSGAGLHVGHPLGYIASDIYSRYKRLKGFNVLHPMGFDSFGLPAEQYALETGQHPAATTEKNIATFKEQLDKIGFCYDWSREVRTSDPDYYKWTQWIFLKLFNSFFCTKDNKAKPIEELIKVYETEGNVSDNEKNFTATGWKSFSEKQQQEILMQKRLAFCAYGEVNWCEALGTVLANDEVVNGLSERGGHIVEKRKMRQWYLRITAYADRLLQGLDSVAFSDSMKEMQKNWIGKSEGAEMDFALENRSEKIKVYTTRPDTIFGVDFMVLAPEHELVESITTTEQKAEVEKYLTYVKSRSDRERQAEVKQISGCFTGAYALNPFNNQKIPVYIAEYVLAGYGTGAIMAVPCGDQRDFAFAKHFNIPITNIIGSFYNGEEANATKEATLENSGFLTGMLMSDAIGKAIDEIEKLGIGKRKINFRMRDAGFSRQRYWGEPFPIIWSDGIAIPLTEDDLPLELPHVDTYGQGPDGQGPLANIKEWVQTKEGLRETSTMPGYAGSSWYFLRFMDAHNAETFCSREASDYWNQVDVYIGGTEHAVGHLLYSRLWTKVLYDLDFIGFDEPFKKLLNQGMIGGISEKIIREGKNQFEDENGSNLQSKDSIWIFFAKKNNEPFCLRPDLVDKSQDGMNFYVFNFSSDVDFKNENISYIRTSLDNVENGNLNLIKYRESLKDRNKKYNLLKHEIFLCKEGYFDTKRNCWFDYNYNPISPLKFKTIQVPEKMSKRYGNVVNPDEIIAQYGADTFRMYEMFLGPVEQSKPWDTKGIEGVHRFLRKLWRLFNDEIKGKIVTEEKASSAELKILHRTIKKIEEDTDKFSFNTAVSAFMICVNELADVKCHKREILEPLLILLVPYAPHIAEELWHQLGNETTILDANYPKFNPGFLVESNKTYPVSINGKVRASMDLSLSLEAAEVEKLVMENEVILKWLEGKIPKKIIFVKGKMINVVV